MTAIVPEPSPPMVEAIRAELKGHRRDSFNQDSGNHCECGSDSRFSQTRGGLADPPWESIDEHRAQRVVALLQRMMREAME